MFGVDSVGTETGTWGMATNQHGRQHSGMNGLPEPLVSGAKTRHQRDETVQRTLRLETLTKETEIGQPAPWHKAQYSLCAAMCQMPLFGSPACFIATIRIWLFQDRPRRPVFNVTALIALSKEERAPCPDSTTGMREGYLHT